MSDQDNQNGVITASPSEQNMVPKERLDELISQRRLLEEQLQVTQHLLRQAVPPQAQAVQEEPPHLKQLKEENPAVYQELVSLKKAEKQRNAVMFQMLDNQDREQFLREFGEVGGKDYLPRVEEEMAKLRAQNISNYNRGQIFLHLKGLDSVRAPKPKATPAPEAKPAPVATASDTIPSSDPSDAGTTRSGSTTSGTGRKTIEEMEKELENFKF